MEAIVQDHYGSPEVLAARQIDRPAVGDGEVLVRVRAASVNFGDGAILRGRPFLLRLATGLRRPRNPVPGVDLAGEVEAVGPDVTALRPGDEVFGRGRGSLAEFAVSAPARLARKPATVSFEQAAAVPLAATTALQGLRDHGWLQAGQQVLIIGASGGVGSFAVQIAKAFGAQVTGVCSTRNVELVRSLGADEVVDYTRSDLVSIGERYDLILQVAGTASPLALRRLLTPTGALVLSSGRGRLAGIDRIVAARLASPFVRQRLVVFVERESAEDLGILRELLEAGRITPVIDRTYPLAEAPEAFRYLEAGHTRGKVVITV
jgi:NADPH:quinone reductase-like Zn-dependent oxidoreductase